MSSLVKAFSRNRAEEMGADLWGDFVVPPYFDRLPVMHVRKPYVIVGGRGCGKTTLLRYWSYHSQFSKNRTELPAEVFETIGLYIRTDIQFLSSFVGSGIDDVQWKRAFEHALCLSVADELLGCLTTINCTPERTDQYGHLEDLDFSALAAFDAAIPTDFRSMHKHIKQSRFKLSSWINNLSSEIPAPIFYPLRTFIGALIETIHTLPYLKESVFSVFVDEYESFLDYQQVFVNSLLKLSQPPLVFHVAMKRNGMPNRRTTGPEYIQDPADFRTIDIEKEQGDDFEMFAAELFFFRLIRENISLDGNPIDPTLLRDPAKLNDRRGNASYRAALRSVMERVLPSVSISEIAAGVLKEPSLKKRLIETIDAGLVRNNPGTLTPTDFVDEKFPEASIVVAALLHQRKKSADVYAEFQKLTTGKSSSFEEWTHHFLFGALLFIYVPLSRSCPLYSGFQTFISLAQGNARHFLELCLLATGRVGRKGTAQENGQITVSVEDQAEAARECSAKFLEDIKGSGNYGTQLYQVATTIGQIFKLHQQRPAQSEPEKNHFAVTNGNTSDSAAAILKEAEKWGVLVSRKETKVKGLKYESQEYYLNPVFSPTYGISYRAGRKLDLAAATADKILLGDDMEATKVIREFERSWRLDSDQMSLIDGVQ
ncbi:hypothetical protein D0T24_30755 [Duganella sp. BJB480]|uniref:ORC-CDC6 family AAA ATPase n=1 Tax=unclassified Duganella TaxID=2636909 RepID=UPI000E34C9D7|nr:MULTISPECIES: hypothetical protein [unclassified Duganella]NVD74571.1 hypothetical protein [Duganella sp. BJB1802]RFP09114.1 hypothetical protein D0T26_30225 [Duganella sp. BJB489]RFP29112.1 hypothetical protein D0T24_30755 [Duganella sp. BJB480]